jgi:hypothetical protein
VNLCPRGSVDDIDRRPVDYVWTHLNNVGLTPKPNTRIYEQE